VPSPDAAAGMRTRPSNNATADGPTRAQLQGIAGAERAMLRVPYSASEADGPLNSAKRLTAQTPNSTQTADAQGAMSEHAVVPFTIDEVHAQRAGLEEVSQSRDNRVATETQARWLQGPCSLQSRVEARRKLRAAMASDGVGASANNVGSWQPASAHSCGRPQGVMDGRSSPLDSVVASHEPTFDTGSASGLRSMPNRTPALARTLTGAGAGTALTRGGLGSISTGAGAMREVGDQFRSVQSASAAVDRAAFRATLMQARKAAKRAVE
jgi:hypothetical protein